MATHPTIQAAIKALAVSYRAYSEATSTDDSNGIVVWGEILIEDQEATGVELHPATAIRRHVNLHREAAKKQIAEAA
jgi:hypothetical protein